MNATVKAKSQEFQVTKFVKWENDHKKYEGVVYMVNKNGKEYMGFVRKNSTVVDVHSCGMFQTRFYAVGEVDGLTITPMPSDSELFENAIAEKFGIGAKVAITNEGVLIDVQTIQSANTLLRAFRRHKALIRANDYMNYSMFIPNATTKILLL